MSKHVEQILNSILEDYKREGNKSRELEAKSLFMLLNYCPPPDSSVPEKTGNRR